MPKLKIQAPDGKFLMVDVSGYTPDQYDNLATAAIEDYTSKQVHNPIPSDVVNEPGLEDATLSTIHNLGTLTKAGYAGLGNLETGQGLEQAASDVKNVEEGKVAETTPGKIGEAFGGLVTPEQITLQGGIGKFLEASGIGEWASSILKTWSENAAVSAVGKIKQLAKLLGVDNLSGLGQFLLSPLTIGSKEFPAIVTATSDAEEMLQAARAIQKAAGSQLGKIAGTVDASIKEATEQGANAPVAIDLAKLQQTIGELKAAVEDVAPNLGKAVVNQYKNAILDLNNLVSKALQGNSETIFSDLSELKTTIGDLVYKHGNPLESKQALNDVYQAISQTLEDAAKKVGGATSDAYTQANDVYHKIIAIIEGLEGKAVDAKNLFNTGALSGATGMITTALTHNPIIGLASMMAPIAGKIASSYAPQALAAGLGTMSRAAPTTIELGTRLLGSALQPAAQAISSALNNQ